MKKTYLYNNQEYTIDVKPNRSGEVQALINGVPHTSAVLRHQGSRVIIRTEKTTFECHVAVSGREIWVAYRGRTYRLQKPLQAGRQSRNTAAADHQLHAPMPGQVRDIQVEPGQAVTHGQTLLILEAMKMEIRIQAPHDGVVARVLVALEQSVEKDQLLVELE